jgi:hypothetical protein
MIGYTLEASAREKSKKKKKNPIITVKESSFIARLHALVGQLILFQRFAL